MKLRIATALLIALLVEVPARDVVAADCDIYVVENAADDCNYFLESAKKELETQGHAPISAGNLQQLAANVAQKMANENCDCLRDLVIVGHGTNSTISVGSGCSSTNKSQYIGLDNQAQWTTPLTNIGNLFCPNLLLSEGIHFYGCGVGMCTNATVGVGTKLLHDIAQVAGVTVWGPTVPTVLGDNISSYLQTGEWQVGVPGEASPRPCTVGSYSAVPRRRPASGDRYYCPCNGIAYEDIGDCTNRCQPTLACYANICERYKVNNAFEPYSGGAMLLPGAPGSWEDAGVSQPTVLRASPYQMWYAGWDSTEVMSIGRAASSYGFDWTKDPANPVLEPGPFGSWDDGSVYNPSVIKDGGVYKIWYTGWSSATTGAQIGYASSADGIHWTKYASNPVLVAGPGGAWDEDAVAAPTVIKNGSVFEMWYEAVDSGGWWRIGHATSPDGVHWTKDTSNPVLSEGGVDSFTEWGVGTPSVVKWEGAYHMLHVGFDYYGTATIGYATSPDGRNWTQAGSTPVLSAAWGDGFDSVDVGHPVLMVDANESLLEAFYRGYDGSGYAIGQAVEFSPEPGAPLAALAAAAALHALARARRRAHRARRS